MDDESRSVALVRALLRDDAALRAAEDDAPMDDEIPRWRELVVENVEDDAEFFGACPECGYNDGYTNVGRSHWFFCRKHKVCWCVGANLFSSWRHETEEEQRAIFDRIGIDNFREIEPLDDRAAILRLREPA
jgi:hypothetical protein